MRIFYSLVEDSPDGVNAFRVWRQHFPEEELAIAAVEALILPFKTDLRSFRNRLGFHGSRSRAHEARGFDLFGAHSGDKVWAAVKHFKALGATLLQKELALQTSDDSRFNQARERIDLIAQRATEQSGG